MRFGRPAKVVFATFPTLESAEHALEELDERQYKTAGYSALRAETDVPDASAPLVRLRPVLQDLQPLPNLSIQERGVVASGAIAELLDRETPPDDLRAALRSVGAPDPVAASFADTVQGGGILLGVATEDSVRGLVAANVMRACDAEETLVLDVHKLTPDPEYRSGDTAH